MSETNYGSPGNEGSEHTTIHHNVPAAARPYWKRAHHDWRFWVALVITFAAIAMYVISDNLAFAPRV